jgi:DNA-binding response OmpR family regulator
MLIGQARTRSLSTRRSDCQSSEYRLLALLLEAPGRVYTRREIMQHLWQSTYVGDERACDAHVSTLRGKIERDRAHPERIITVPGFGYKLVTA